VGRETDAREGWQFAAFARVNFIARAAAHAASFPRGIARKRADGKFFSARAFFLPPLEQRGSARARQTAIFLPRGTFTVGDALMPSLFSGIVSVNEAFQIDQNRHILYRKKSSY
jgi:hypothetical protein